MADEVIKPPSSVSFHPQPSDLGPSPGGVALPTPQQLSQAPPRQTQSSIMQDTTSATAAGANTAPSQDPNPPSIPSLQERNQTATNTNNTTATPDSRYAAMEASMEARQQDIMMAGTSEQLTNNSSTTAGGPTPKVRAGGAPARIFMNENIVPYLLEGMKNVTRDQPPNPLRALGEFLIQKSNEVEGTGGDGAPTIKSE